MTTTRKMSDQELIEQFIQKNGVTKKGGEKRKFNPTNLNKKRRIIKRGYKIGSLVTYTIDQKDKVFEITKIHPNWNVTIRPLDGNGGSKSVSPKTISPKKEK